MAGSSITQFLFLCITFILFVGSTPTKPQHWCDRLIPLLHTWMKWPRFVSFERELNVKWYNFIGWIVTYASNNNKIVSGGFDSCQLFWKWWNKRFILTLQSPTDMLVNLGLHSLSQDYVFWLTRKPWLNRSALVCGMFWILLFLLTFIRNGLLKVTSVLLKGWVVTFHFLIWFWTLLKL